MTIRIFAESTGSGHGACVDHLVNGPRAVVDSPGFRQCVLARGTRDIGKARIQRLSLSCVKIDRSHRAGSAFVPFLTAASAS